MLIFFIHRIWVGFVVFKAIRATNVHVHVCCVQHDATTASQQGLPPAPVLLQLCLRPHRTQLRTDTITNEIKVMYPNCSFKT